jgi:hypothetical protein
MDERVAAMSNASGHAPVEPLTATPADSLGERLESAGRLLAELGLPFVLIVYLALKGGGYDEIIYDQVGVAVWWIVLLGALIGILPRARIARSGWTALGMMAAFVCWTAIAISWSQSAEQSTAELGRVASYLGVFALAMACQRPGSLRRTVHAIAAAIALVAGLALMQRFHPSWFPDNGAAKLIPASRARLNYPLNYWNGLAAMIAIGIPLLAVVAQKARTLPGQALAAAAIPALTLAGYYTVSRGGALEIAVALVVLLALHPRRLALLPVLGSSALGAGILVAGANQRDALQNGLLSPAAHSQAGEMLAMTLVVCAGVGLVQIAIAVAARNGLGPRPAVSAKTARRAFAGGLAVFVVVAVAAGLPGYLSDRWDEFKVPTGASTTSATRFDSSSGNGRYQWWQAALKADATDPLIGIGPGTYRYWWAQHGTIPGTVLDAHSLYFQTLAETGIIGLIPLLGLVGFVLFAGARFARRAGPDRTYLAGATAGCAAFATAAGVDWVWQLAVLPALFFLLAAAILAGRSGPAASLRAHSSRLAPRLAAAVGCAAALVVIVVPLGSADALSQSQADAQKQQLSTALGKAADAHGFQPYAASPSLQQALLYELQGQYPKALAAARAATRAESTNWQTWFVLSRIEAESGNATGAIDAYRQARSLNPRSPLFAQ